MSETEAPSRANDRQLLLYIAAKVARLDAIATTTHSLLFKDLKPEDKKSAEQRTWILQTLYNKNLDAERNHLRTQFPEEFEILDQYISLGESEHLEQGQQLIKDVMEGRISIPAAFRDTPKSEGEDNKPPEPS